MSGLNIAPNPTALAILLGIFLVNIAIIKNLILMPFLKLKEKRDSQTVGSQDDTKKFLLEHTQLEAQIKSQIDATMKTAALISADIINQAGQTQEAIIKEAQYKAAQSLEILRKEIQNSMSVEKLKLPEINKKLGEVLFNKIVNQ